MHYSFHHKSLLSEINCKTGFELISDEFTKMSKSGPSMGSLNADVLQLSAKLSKALF